MSAEPLQFTYDAAHLPPLAPLPAQWKYANGDFWYVVHDGVALAMICKTYLPPGSYDALVSLWQYQTDSFRSSVLDFARYNKNIGRISPEGVYWGILPVGIEVRMPPQAVQTARSLGIDLSAGQSTSASGKARFRMPGASGKGTIALIGGAVAALLLLPRKR